MSIHDPRRNSFHLLRFILALLVILTHCYTITGRPTPLNRLTAGQLNEGTLAVDCFMVISGFFIAGSALREKNVLRFLANRALRIWPALICALAFTALIVGGLVYDGPYSEYLRIPTDGPLSYMHRWGTFNIPGGQWNITGVFTGNPAQGVNISLWTIKHEVSLYLVIAVLMLLGLKRQKAVYWLLYLSFLALHILFHYHHIQLWDLRSVQAWVLNTWNYDRTTRTAAFFFAGTLIRLYQDRLPRRGAAALISFAALIIGCMLGHGRQVFLLAGPYLVWYLGTSEKCGSFARYGDLSFGLYVYSYPVQQLLLHFFPAITPVVHFAATLLIVLPIAALSWHFIEKPALSLKRYLSPPKAPSAPAA